MEQSASGRRSAKVFPVVAGGPVAWAGVGAEGQRVVAKAAQDFPEKIRSGFTGLPAEAFSILSGCRNEGRAAGTEDVHFPGAQGLVGRHQVAGAFDFFVEPALVHPVELTRRVASNLG